MTKKDEVEKIREGLKGVREEQAALGNGPADPPKKSGRTWDEMLKEELNETEKKIERLKVEIEHRSDAAPFDAGDFMERATWSGWSDDPGTGKSVLIRDSRGNLAYEVPNPLPFAPPVGWEPTPPIEQLIRDRVKAEVDRLKDDDEIDDVIDAEDFDEPDELPPLETIYEVIAMQPEAPALPKDSRPNLEERAKADLDYLEALERQRLLRKRNLEAALKKQREEAESLYGPEDTPPAPKS